MSEAIVRPNGKIYRPRKVIAFGVSDFNEDIGGVVVFGTHDVARAQALADRYVAWAIDNRCRAGSPSRVWWSDGFRYGNRIYETDTEHGRAGVYFAAIVDAPAVADS